MSLCGMSIQSMYHMHPFFCQALKKYCAHAFFPKYGYSVLYKYRVYISILKMVIIYKACYFSNTTCIEEM